MACLKSSDSALVNHAQLGNANTVPQVFLVAFVEFVGLALQNLFYLLGYFDGSLFRGCPRFVLVRPSLGVWVLGVALGCLLAFFDSSPWAYLGKLTSQGGEEFLLQLGLGPASPGLAPPQQVRDGATR